MLFKNFCQEIFFKEILFHSLRSPCKMSRISNTPVKDHAVYDVTDIFQYNNLSFVEFLRDQFGNTIPTDVIIANARIYGKLDFVKRLKTFIEAQLADKKPLSPEEENKLLRIQLKDVQSKLADREKDIWTLFAKTALGSAMQKQSSPPASRKSVNIGLPNRCTSFSV
jgi:hypothetical protein